MSEIRIKDGFIGERSLLVPQAVVDIQKHNPITSGLYIAHIGYYPKALYHFRERAEPIEENVLIYCVDGEGYYVLDGHRYQISPYQYFILPAGVPHYYGSSAESPWTIYWIHFGGTEAKFYAEGARTPQTVQMGVVSRIQDRNRLFEEILSALCNGLSEENLCYASSLLHAYLASLKYVHQYRNALQYKELLEDSTIASAAIYYMKENIEKHLSLDEIAGYLGYSIPHFSSIFRQTTGDSPIQYFNKMKIERACYYLSTTNMKINQICYKIGIMDCFYFSRLFTQIVGISPRKYRNQISQN